MFASESRLISRWNILFPIDSNPLLRGFTTARERVLYYFSLIRARWPTKASRPTFLAMRALSSRRERTSVRHRDEKKGRLVNAPPDQGQPRASIPLPILRRAIIGGPSIPTYARSDSYAVYFVRIYSPSVAPDIPLRASASHVSPGVSPGR